MYITDELLNELTVQAAASERLRRAMDLRNTPDDNSQRILNAIEPGTFVPIHRHRHSSETVVVIRGSVRQNYYDNAGNLVESAIYKSGSSLSIYHVPLGSWHNTESLEHGTIIFEAKDGRYEPMSQEDILAK